MKKSKLSVFAKSDFAKIKLEDPQYKKKLSDALYHVHYELANKQLADAVVAYAKKRPHLKGLPFSAHPDYMYAMVGKYCYIMNNGGELTTETTQKIESILLDLASEAQQKTQEKTQEAQEKKADAEVLSIQDRLRLRAQEIAAEFDAEIDQFVKNPKTYPVDKFKPESVMIKAELKTGHLRYIVGFYQDDIAELDQYLSNSDPDLQEGYAYLGKAGVRKLKKMIESIVDSANMLLTRNKAERKPPKKRVKPVEKVVERLKFKSADSDLKIASVNPVDIVGAKSLWAYNTKTRKLVCYYALDDVGIGVKGSTLTNISTDRSKQKTLRKPVDQLKIFSKGTVAAYEKNFKEIKSLDTVPNNRTNEHLILLKVFR